jgi:hypothetical protein
VLDLRQLPNNLNSLAAYQAVQAIIDHLSSGVAIAQQSNGCGRANPAFTAEAERSAYFDSALAAAQSQINTVPERITNHPGSCFGRDRLTIPAQFLGRAAHHWVFIPLFGISATFAYDATLARCAACSPPPPASPLTCWVPC